jgi:type IX secretion system PorP/SprF family membrane protein
MKKLLFFFILISGQAFAQDIHFSQFYMAPLHINPALTGSFNGNVRAGLNYKEQWKSIASPYKTIAFGCDGAFMKKKWNGAYLGGGLFVYSDKAGDLNLGTTLVNLSFSGIVTLNENHSMSAGIQGGLIQRSINGGAMRWDNQFDGYGHNSAFNSNESASFNSLSYGDFSTGVAWSYGTDDATLSSNDGLRLNAGVSYHHLTKPTEQFYITPDRLYSKIIAHAGARYGVKNTNFAIVPNVIFMSQGPAREITFGTYVRYIIKEESRFTGIFKETAVSIGSYYRHKDAVIAAFMFEYANYAIGVTYDINVSGLRPASSSKGGFELALRFINPNPFRTGSGHHKNVRFL